jgi:hypothetical protein
MKRYMLQSRDGLVLGYFKNYKRALYFFTYYSFAQYLLCDNVVILSK